VFSAPILDPRSNRIFVTLSQYSDSHKLVVAGAFSPETLANQILFPSYPKRERVTLYLLDTSRRLLFTNGSIATENLPVLATWLIRLVFGDFRKEFRQAITLSHPSWARSIL